jgi:molybdate transport system substrate-binding protein
MFRGADWLYVGLAGAAFCCSLSRTALAQSRGLLEWPAELPQALSPEATHYISGKSNVVLDLHGSDRDPDLVIFMAGNQYRVIPELLAAFRKWVRAQPRHHGAKVERIFYATTPPGRLIDAMESGQLVLGNYWLDVRPDALWPDVFMTGPRQQRRLRKSNYIDGWSVYTRNRGVVLLIRAGNPKGIHGISDLLREDVRVAISSPVREPASYESYSNTLRAQGGAAFPELILKKATTISPAAVHHRENPQFIYDDQVDVAPMYYHFGEYLKSHIPAVFDYVALPERGNFRDELAISLIRNAPHRAAALAWIDFMRSEEAAAIYNKNGFEYASAAERSRVEDK